MSRENIVAEILSKLKGKYIISYNELNDLLPNDLFDADVIEKILDALEKNGILFNEDIKRDIRIKRNYKKEDTLTEEYIDNPEKFYFYELYKKEKNLSNKENEYIKELKKIYKKIVNIFITSDFLLKGLIQDLSQNKKNIDRIINIDREKNIFDIINSLKRYLKNKRFLNDLNLKRDYIEESLEKLKNYMQFHYNFDAKLIKIQEKYKVNDNLLNKLIEDLEEGISDISNLSDLETELYPIIMERKKWNRFIYKNKNIQEVYDKITYLYKQYDITREKLITLLLPLVINIAKYFQGSGVALNDLIQEGNITLIEGIERFIQGESDKSFSHYITWWIRNEMSEVIARNKAVTTISKNLIADIKRFIKTSKKLRGELLRNPTEFELADALKWKTDKVKWVIKYLKNPIYLDSKLNESAKETFKELIPDTNYSAPDEAADNNIMKDKINQILEKLKPLEKEIITLKFNLNNKVSVSSYEDMSKYLSMPISKIKNIEKMALNKLKKFGDDFNLRDFL